MAKATAIFDGDDSRLQTALKRIEKSLQAVQAKFATFAKVSAGVAATAAAAMVGIAAGVKGVLDTAGDFLDLQNQTGIAVEDLVNLDQEAKNSGKSIEDVAGSVNKMQ